MEARWQSVTGRPLPMALSFAAWEMRNWKSLGWDFALLLEIGDALCPRPMKVDQHCLSHHHETIDRKTPWLTDIRTWYKINQSVQPRTPTLLNHHDFYFLVNGFYFPFWMNSSHIRFIKPVMKTCYWFVNRQTDKKFRHWLKYIWKFRKPI